MLDEGTATRNALQIADEVAQLGATLDDQQLDGRVDGHDAVAEEEFRRRARPRRRTSRCIRRFPRTRSSVSARTASVSWCSSARTPTRLPPRSWPACSTATRHPYGYTELGTEASVKAMTRDAMVAFWKQNFVPNNAALVVAGDITMAELRAARREVVRKLAARHAGAAVARRRRRPTPARVVIVDRPGAPQTQLRVAAIGAARSSPDFRALQVMNTALGGLFSSRINMNLREEHGYTYGANSQFVFRKAPGPFQVAAGIRTDVTAPAVTEIFKEIRGMIERR